MGIVWRAHDELLDRVVAVKEVRYSAMLGEEVQLLNRRTMREARAAARFEHPNVIVVHDVIEEDDQPWIVMQLVPSRSLGQVIKEDGRLDPGRVAEIGLAMLDALHSAHEAGVLHRDVKPENVLLADDGRVVLTDFGIATLETETQLTMTGLAGTPAFIAPERLKGLPARRESDLWALGATLYTAVEGRSPHDKGMAMATMHAVLNDDPAPAQHAGVLGPVIDGLLAKEPVHRLSYAEATRMLRNAIAQSHTETVADEDDTPTDPGIPVVPAAPPIKTAPPKKPAQPYKAPYRTPPKAIEQLPKADPPETGVRLEPDPSEPTVEGRGPMAKRFRPIVAVVAAVAIVGGVAGYLGLNSAPETKPKKQQAATATSSASAEPSTSPTVQPSQTPTEEPAKDALPKGWKMHKDKKKGFSVALPKGWEEFKRNSNQVFFRGPGAGSNAFLMIEEAENPGDDPLKDWKKQEPSAKHGFGGYKLIHIKEVDYMKAAADWEFTWNTNTGKTRVRNRGFVTDNGRGYALYWHNLASRWKKDLHFFDTFAASFKPAK